jgi:ubiquinone/menaquinone biosynthesis C-methylase UbiE
MADVYANIGDLGADQVAPLARAMELRAHDPVQRGFVEEYLAELPLPAGARVLEIGCGTGAISRILAGDGRVAEVVGIDPSRPLLDRARELAAGDARIRFEEGDGRALPVPGDAFDAVVLHTVLSHVPGPERVLAEAHRVLRPGGWVAVFDGDYRTISVATGDPDPLDACARAFMEAYINDRWLVPRLPALLASAGFADVRVRGHGYVQAAEPDYLLSVVERGALALTRTGRIGEPLARALVEEAGRRVAVGAFFGQIAYVSALARRATAPGS